MDAIYQWIRQISIFAVLSFLVFYLMENKEKKQVLRFYLSLMMMFLVLKPFSALSQIEAAMAAKLEQLETEWEIPASSQQVISKIMNEQNQQIMTEAESKGLEWIRDLLQEQEIKLQKGTIQFDEEQLQENGEVVITGIRLEIEKKENVQETVRMLQGKIAQQFSVEESMVRITAS